jgi:hypothetical protein
MILKDIRQECWDIARETATNDNDRLWTKAEMNRYINRVYRLIAKETRCIRDDISYRITSTPYANYAALQAAAVTDPYAAEDVLRITTTGSWFYVDPDPAETYAARLDAQAQTICPYVYALDPKIIDVEEAKWTSRQWRLTKTSVKKWQMNPYWEQVIGMPTEYATDLGTNKLVLNFRGTTADTLKLVVRRLPLADLVADTDYPEFRESYHDFFRYGVLEQMYSKQDTQAIDLAKATDYKALFKADLDEIKQQEALLDERLRPNYSMGAFR